eukprot:CAMPEP_0113648244 /NCGR_PEP_ID=MMETSP0017_2-20120614/25580_1 /TAXON_ID=2856 /ORGANISM="Cylindrotheca closterium" /LENGTH=124 /DNA_ID=CAMNT_0000560433 /DNA_START=236 /DNA_END=610 /DNA_ORIENTATION=- /assembly_acc=CAM_ASM_000147
MTYGKHESVQARVVGQTFCGYYRWNLKGVLEVTSDNGTMNKNQNQTPTRDAYNTYDNNAYGNNYVNIVYDNNAYGNHNYNDNPHGVMEKPQYGEPPVVQAQDVTNINTGTSHLEQTAVTSLHNT